MLRGVKKFAYGLFYLLIVTLIIWGAVSFFGSHEDFPTAPEIEESYFSVSVVKKLKFFQLESGETAFLVKFGNPNSDADISFSYKFIVFGKDGERIGEVRGSDLLSPRVEEFVAELGDFDETVKEVRVETFDETYTSASGSLKEDIMIREIAVEVEEKRVKIRGVLENEGLLSMPKVKIVGVLADEFGFQLFAGGTVLENIESFGKKGFEIFVPVDEEIKEKMDAASTQVYVNLE